jgi:hypothetical protein
MTLEESLKRFEDRSKIEAAKEPTELEICGYVLSLTERRKDMVRALAVDNRSASAQRALKEEQALIDAVQAWVAAKT